MRKPPVRHAVKSYKRNGKTVHSHLRGYGFKGTNTKRLPKDYLQLHPKEFTLSSENIKNYHFPHTEEEMRKDSHCPTCICDICDTDFNPDPEESDDHCPTCTCENPTLQAEVSKRIAKMKEEARRKKK